MFRCCQDAGVAFTPLECAQSLDMAKSDEQIISASRIEDRRRAEESAPDPDNSPCGIAHLRV